MKKETPFLDFYHECMRSGRMPGKGLCQSFGHDDAYSIIDYLTPWGYWGYDGRALVEQDEDDEERYVFDYTEKEIVRIKLKTVRYKFTTLRQTVVLLCAAINREL